MRSGNRAMRSAVSAKLFSCVSRVEARRPGVILAILLGTLAALTSGCPASKKPSRIEAMMANMAKDVAIPWEARGRKNPLPGSDEAVEEGQQLYMLSCAMCHGTDGHSQTRLGLAMYPPAMDLTSPHVQHWNDAELFWIIQNGVRLTGMPAWKTMLSEADSWKIVHFLHALPRLEAAAAARREAEAAQSQAELLRRGEALYRQEACFMCHQLYGEGGKVGPDLSVEGTRGRSNDWLIAHFKDPSAFVPGSLMPPFKNLTDAQLQALVAFLQSQKGQKK